MDFLGLNTEVKFSCWLLKKTLSIQLLDQINILIRLIYFLHLFAEESQAYRLSTKTWV